MVKRFLAYSLAHNRPIRVWMADTMKCKNITVIGMEENQISFLAAGRKKPSVISMDRILSASYARGDDGDTLKYANQEGEYESNP